MKKVVGARASTILYNTLMANKSKFSNRKFILPANICPIVPLTLLKAGIFFEFLDISPQTQCMIPEEIYSRIDKNPGLFCGVIYLHSYGFLQDLKSLFSSLKERHPSIFLIDDQCVCMPDIIGTSVLADTNLTLFSTGYAKFVEFGAGGFAYLNESTDYIESEEVFLDAAHQDLLQKITKSLEDSTTFLYTDSPWLVMTNDINDQSYFKDIESQIPITYAHKIKINKIYADIIPSDYHMGENFSWRFNLQVPDKQRIIKKIFESGLFASSHYKSIANIFGNMLAPVANHFHNHMINLFNDYRFTEDMAIKVAEIVKRELK
jgi:dTDP-4-amino-4,6-dideoxygalactose transaminase